MQKIIEEAQRQQGQQQSDVPGPSGRPQSNDDTDFSELEDRIGFIGAGQVTSWPSWALLTIKCNLRRHING